MQKTVPDHSPLIAYSLICQTCGERMKMEIQKGRRGVESMVYKCINPVAGCSYQIEVTQYITAEVKGIRPDGAVAKV